MDSFSKNDELPEELRTLYAAVAYLSNTTMMDVFRIFETLKIYYREDANDFDIEVVAETLGWDGENVIYPVNIDRRN
jgi:hypothetical protein